MDDRTIASLKRANAAVAWQAAKRGMFCLLQQRHSYLSLKDGWHEYDRFVPGIVSSVSRDGTVQRVRVAGGADLRLDRRDWSYCHVDSRSVIADPAGLAAKLVTEFGVATEFNALAEAMAAVKDAREVLAAMPVGETR